MPLRRTWNARWIWAPDARAVNAHVLFRADFTCEHPTEGAALYVAAESFARVYLNGREVLQTSSLSYPTQHYFERVLPGDALRPGTNQLAVLAWYIGVPSGASCPKDPGLLFELVDAEGRAILAGGDSRFRCRVLDAWRGRQRRSFWLNLDLVETLDARRLPADFPMVRDLSAFAPAEVQGSAGVRYVDLQLRDFPKPCGDTLRGATELFRGSIRDRSAEHEAAHTAVVEEQEEVRARQTAPRPLADAFVIPPQPPGEAYAVLIDLGRYEKGLPRLTAVGCRGAVVDLTWFEHLDPPVASATVSGVHATDRTVLPARRFDLCPEEWKCGRYLRLTFRSVTKPLRIRGLRWERRHAPVERRFRFESASERLNRIVEICVDAAALCMHDNIMDCPWRERRQWIGDAQRIGLTAHYAFGERRLLRAVLAQQVHLQDVNGRMYACLPIFEEYPTQSMDWLRAVMEYDRYTGDTSLLAEVGDNIEMLHRWFLRETNRDPRGLLRIVEPPVMNFIDNTFGSVFGAASPVRAHQSRTAFAAVNLRYLGFLDDVAEAMGRLGRPWAVGEARRRRAELAAIIPGAFLDAEVGLLRDCAEPDVPATFSELTHARAVLAGLAAEGASSWWARFRAVCAARPGLPTIAAGPFGMHDVLEAMGRLGLREEMVGEILARWGVMVDAGADASWEVFAPTGSRCHGWGGIVWVALARHVFGLDPAAGGRRRIGPLAGIPWMEGEIHPAGGNV